MALTQVPTGMIADQAVTTAKLLDGGTTPAKLSQPLTQGTSVATTSGTSIDFTSIPSWVKRITVALNAVSLSATANLLVQLGSGSVETTGYASASAYGGSSVDGGATNVTNGFVVRAGLATATVSGVMTIVNVSGNIWAASFAGARTDGNASSIAGGGVKTLSGTIDRLRLTSTSTDTFDAGSVNILYE